MSASFDSLDLAPELLQVLQELGHDTPTAVQSAAIPALLAGRDVIGQSRTGSGKTAAFALPMLQRVRLDQRALQGLVLCPTRELSAQVLRELRTLGRRLPGLVVAELAGGQPIGPQLAALERGVHLAVGTPGRLLDHIGRRSLDAAAVTSVVLDEADRMLDMGFGDDVESIFEALPRRRQTALFSATFPKAIESLSARVQRDAQRVTVDDPREALPEIRQYRLECEAEDSFDALRQVLARFPHDSALLFCNFKASVRELAGQLTEAGFSAARFDGDLAQFQRDQVLARFRNQSVRLLVATDVAGRGLDVQGLDLVINYELPQQAELYVHRIGRTGRAGKAGVAVSLMTPRQMGRFRSIEERVAQPIEALTFERPKSKRADPKDASRSAAMATVLISGGRKDKLRAGDVLGALTGEAGGLAGDDVGRIEIQDRLTYVAVARASVDRAIQRLNAGRIKGKRFKASLAGEGDVR